ncbi:uncharacterized protein BX663DRAFT_500387 [Cokeromyces recurvatus]|uniref:uncharacterized protein n=1 Tax=Cokeromyces recurvatus TaxID=90255 RepID=UPI002220A794|nr:uncharacterized protein BX663DRAFT_500387 [Cokeromyces recurvatus]KAI7905630.1 hypothetical protein BX663DRAFT_500387 [Cokeromyces recurvatus]
MWGNTYSYRFHMIVTVIYNNDLLILMNYKKVDVQSKSLNNTILFFFFFPALGGNSFSHSYHLCNAF